jgi:hypothetical protein
MTRFMIKISDEMYDQNLLQDEIFMIDPLIHWSIGPLVH